MSTSAESASFRLLDLPTELRLMVYERIPTTTRKHELQSKPHGSEYPAKTALQVEHLPVSILATCKQINKEATPIIASKLATLRVAPIYLTVNTGHLRCFLGPSDHRIGQYIDLQDRRKAMEHNNSCQSMHCHECDEHNLFCALDCLRSQRSPSYTILTVERSLSNSIMHAYSNLSALILRWEHRTKLPPPVLLHFRGAYDDNSNDPPNSKHPIGFYRGMLEDFVAETALGTCCVEILS